MFTSRGSARLFQNEWLERFSHVHPVMPLLVFGPVVGINFWLGLQARDMAWGSTLVCFFSGLAFWTLAEYFLHRYIFHYPFQNEFGKRFHYIIHGNHHDIPDDPTRLVMPPGAAILLASLFYFLFWLVLSPANLNGFFSGFIFGYLVYDYTHYSVHHFKPITPVGRYLKQSHMLHHFVSPESRWGVSSPIWDWFFGTLEPKNKSARSHKEHSAV